MDGEQDPPIAIISGSGVGRRPTRHRFPWTLAFDEKAALAWARLLSEGRAAGKPRSDLDMMVAAVAETNECVIVTDNDKHFSGLDALNPLRTLL